MPFEFICPSRPALGPGGAVPGHSHYIPEIILYFAATAARALYPRDYISRTKLVFLSWIKLVKAHLSAMRPLPSLLLLCGSYGGTAIAYTTGRAKSHTANLKRETNHDKRACVVLDIDSLSSSLLGCALRCLVWGTEACAQRHTACGACPPREVWVVYRVALHAPTLPLGDRIMSRRQLVPLSVSSQPHADVARAAHSARKSTESCCCC